MTMIIGHKCDFILGILDTDASLAKCRYCGRSIVEGWEDPPPEPEKPLEFDKYRSVHNIALCDVIEQVKLQGFAGYSWVATSKLHGSNFSIMADAEKVVACSKNQIIPEGDSHFRHELMMPFLTRIIKEMQSYFGKNIQVYFELFGGSYPHEMIPVDKRFSRVAKGIWYCPTIDVRVIDIQVDGVYLNFDEMVEIAERHRLKPVAVLGRGSFDQMLEISPEFEDETYKEYNLPKIENNFSEGLVLRPTKECLFSNGKRVMLKNKCKRMSERRAPRAPRKDVVLDELEMIALEELSCCITEGRLENILSHGHDFSKKQFGMLVGLMMKDIHKELPEDSPFHSLDKDGRKKVNTLAMGEVTRFLKPFWINMINDF